MKQQLLNLFATPRDMTWEDILLNIMLAAVLGFFIFLSYALSHRGTIYSRKFNASLVILAVLTGTVMTCRWAWWAPCPSSGSARPSRTPATRCISSGPSSWASAAAWGTTPWPASAAP